MKNDDYFYHHYHHLLFLFLLLLLILLLLLSSLLLVLLLLLLLWIMMIIFITIHHHYSVNTCTRVEESAISMLYVLLLFHLVSWSPRQRPSCHGYRSTPSFCPLTFTVATSSPTTPTTRATMAKPSTRPRPTMKSSDRYRLPTQHHTRWCPTRTANGVTLGEMTPSSMASQMAPIGTPSKEVRNGPYMSCPAL